MKKIIIAAIAFTMLVACGGTNVEDQAVEYNEKILKAVEAGDYEKVGELEAEMDKWYESLSEADQKKAAEAWIQWGAERARKDVEELEKAFENL